MTYPDDDFRLGTAQAADILDLSHDTVARLADRGEIPSRRTPGGHRRFRAADVIAYAHTVNPDRTPAS